MDVDCFLAGLPTTNPNPLPRLLLILSCLLKNYPLSHFLLLAICHHPLCLLLFCIASYSGSPTSPALNFPLLPPLPPSPPGPILHLQARVHCVHCWHNPLSSPQPKTQPLFQQATFLKHSCRPRPNPSPAPFPGLPSPSLPSYMSSAKAMQQKQDDKKYEK